MGLRPVVFEKVRKYPAAVNALLFVGYRCFGEIGHRLFRNSDDSMFIFGYFFIAVYLAVIVLSLISFIYLIVSFRRRVIFSNILQAVMDLAIFYWLIDIFQEM